MNSPDFWGNQEQAQTVIQQVKALKLVTQPLTEVATACDEISTYLEMADEDPSATADVRNEIGRLEVLSDDLELRALMRLIYEQSGGLQ